MRDRTNDIEQRLAQAEITFFDEDPENDPGRAGDGYYYSIPGKPGWSGAWHSYTEAEEEARDEIASDFAHFDSLLERYETPVSESCRRFLVHFSTREHIPFKLDFLVWPQEDGSFYALVDVDRKPSEEDATERLADEFPEIIKQRLDTQLHARVLNVEESEATVFSLATNSRFPHPDPDPAVTPTP